ncbi:hypothetical protein [Legionella israelensis]|uniref:Uncharacterized protein n=1 Tax=Legionella israelensis TaxID=454 RepID=A0A0W0V2H7_9GAMM|nr:hypothetical protein [Legionella israelensis]KTD14320.1 hypothetical protein Lisr_2548 [Legionella israelensis]QBS09752.1 hypothetical protein E4T55_07700 [Legionella israelensis]SCY43098.1 hypothetical protein SAMN02746069_02419 [Legionella israelensis DSM 19235]STX59292.1 Uncharacterised protein [Legionella israelensis]
MPGILGRHPALKKELVRLVTKNTKQAKADKKKTIEQKREKREWEALQQDLKVFETIAALTKAGALGYSALRELVDELSKEIKHPRLIGEMRLALERVFSEKEIIALINRLLVNDIIGTLQNQDLVFFDRSDKFSTSLLRAVYDGADNKGFTEDFMKQIIPPMMLQIAQDSAVAASLGTVREKDSYSVATKNTILSIVTMYFESLKQFSADSSRFPEAMSEGAGAVYYALNVAINRLQHIQERYMYERYIPVTFSKGEIPELLEDKRVNAQELAVYLVGIYLNLRLLRISFESYVSSLSGYNPTQLFHLIDSTIDKDQILTMKREFETIMKRPDASSGFDAMVLEKALNSSEQDFKKQLKHLVQKQGKPLKLLFSQENVLSEFPMLSRYVHFLLCGEEMLKMDKLTFIREIRKLVLFLQEPVEELCVEGINGLKKESQETENKQEIDSDASDKVKLIWKLKEMVQIEYKDPILTLYAKMATRRELSSDTKPQNVPIYYKKEHVASLLGVSILEKHKGSKELNQTASGRVLSSIYKNFLEEIVICNNLSLHDLHADLFSLITFISMTRENNEIQTPIQLLFKKTMRVLDDVDAKSMEPVARTQAQEILACLAYIGSAFNVQLMDDFTKLTEKFDEEGYKNAFHRFSISLEKFDSDLKSFSLKGVLTSGLSIFTSTPQTTPPTKPKKGHPQPELKDQVSP